MVDQTLRKRDREAWNEVDGPQGGDQTFGSILKKDEKTMSRTQKLLSKINSQPEGYAECYPGQQIPTNFFYSEMMNGNLIISLRMRDDI